MNLQQRKKELEAKLLAKINEELSQLHTPKKKFWEIMQSINRPFLTKSEWPYEIFFYRDNDLIMSYNKETKFLGCSYPHLWSVLETEYNMEYDDIEQLIKVQAEEAFKVKGDTKMEEAFKVDGAAPYYTLNSATPWWKKHLK